jgi:hypothetical protein
MRGSLREAVPGEVPENERDNPSPKAPKHSIRINYRIHREPPALGDICTRNRPFRPGFATTLRSPGTSILASSIACGRARKYI